jgi:hypothetical protein
MLEWEKWRVPGRSFDTKDGYVMRFPDHMEINVAYQATTRQHKGAIYNTLEITTNDMDKFKRWTREWLRDLADRQGWTFDFDDD